VDLVAAVAVLLLLLRAVLAHQVKATTAVLVLVAEQLVYKPVVVAAVQVKRAQMLRVQWVAMVATVQLLLLQGLQ
jgi:hypothetical protein